MGDRVRVIGCVLLLVFFSCSRKQVSEAEILDSSGMYALDHKNIRYYLYLFGDGFDDYKRGEIEHVSITDITVYGDKQEINSEKKFYFYNKYDSLAQIASYDIKDGFYMTKEAREKQKKEWGIE